MNRLKVIGLALAVCAGAHSPAAHSQAKSMSAPSASATALEALAELEVAPYLGTWYQVALFPNSFQRQCVADTTATYRSMPNGEIEVTNRCRTAEGRFDEAMGLARPVGTLAAGRLTPAKLEVSFLPAWLRWLPVGWGRYWVIQLAADGRYAVVSEPTREYLWILSRTPVLATADESAIRSRLAEQGFDLIRLQGHPQTTTPR